MRKLSMDELGRPDVSEVRLTEKLPVVVVLDNIRSGLNVGSVFRTADAFGVEKIILCGITTRPPHREILKTALGATETVLWEYAQDTMTALRKLQDEGYRILPVEQTDASVPLQKIETLSGSPVALVFGNEVQGVSTEVISAFSQSIEIPQFGMKHSLNVSVSAGIVLWHFAYVSGRLRV